MKRDSNNREPTAPKPTVIDPRGWMGRGDPQIDVTDVKFISKDRTTRRWQIAGIITIEICFLTVIGWKAGLAVIPSGVDPDIFIMVALLLAVTAGLILIKESIERRKLIRWKLHLLKDKK